MADSWIGGDLGGLRTMVATLSPAPTDMDGVVHAVTSAVDQLIDDAGWSGGAAEAFRHAWSTDALAAGVLSEVVRGITKEIERLVDVLEALDRTLREAAEIAMRAGVPIDHQGNVLAFTVPDPPDEHAETLIAAEQAYAGAAHDIRQAAQQARQAATESLGAFLDQLQQGLVQPPTLTPDGKLSALALLRTLMVTPNEAGDVLLGTFDQRLARLQNERRAAKTAIEDARAAGAQIKPGDPLYAEYREAINGVKSLEQDAAAVRAGRAAPAWMDAVNVKFGDIGIVEAAKLPKFLQFAKELPVIDIAASTAAAGLQTKDDVEKGWSVPHAVAVDFGSAAVGVGTGIGVVTLAASAPVTLPVGLVVAGAGLIGFGVGDVAYQAFHEHWSEDIHEHGLVGGIVTGSENSAARVGGDVANIGVEIKDGAIKAGGAVWGALFG